MGMARERTDRGHMNEKLNLRSFYLRLLRKIWLIPLAGIIGAVLALGIYTLVTVTFGPARSYQTRSQFYIKFAYDENAGTLVDHYNAYTWNSLMSSNEVLNKIMEELDDDSITSQQVINAITAEIPSDVRVLLVTVKENSVMTTDAITTAVIASLESYGKTNEAFDSIKLLNTEEPQLVTYTDRSTVAVVFGFCLGVFAAILLLLLLDALDDAVYVPEDLEERCGLPLIGVLFKNEDKAVAAAEVFKVDLIATGKTLTEGATELLFISADSIRDEKHSEEDLQSFKKALGSKCPEAVNTMRAISIPGKVLDNYRKIATCDGVILAVPYGKRCGSMVEHTIAQLKKHGCRIVGVVLTRADLKFMKTYYRLK
jgi:capsular polysaccharide biosynthesis protein